MQKKHLIAGTAIGGFLLATSSLTSVASAQQLIIDNGGGAANAFSGGGAFAAERFRATTANTLTIGAFDLLYNLGGAASGANTTIRLEVSTNIGTFGTGLTTGVGVAGLESAATTDSVNSNAFSGTLQPAVSLTAASVSTFGGQVTLTTVLGATAINGLRIQDIRLSQVQSLATAGTALTLTGSTFTGNNTQASNSDELTVGTSAESHTISGSAATALTANATATIPFSAFDGGASTGLLATLNVIGDTAQNLSLEAADAVQGLVSSSGGLNVIVTSTALTQAGLSAASVTAAIGATTSTASVSLGAISSTGAFTVASLENGTGYAPGTTSVAINAIFDGSTAIEVADAGTVDATLVGATTSALVTFSGATAPIIRNGISTEVNFFQGAGDSFGTTTFQSFLRISNSGTVAGAATITAVDGDGNSIGTSYTTASIPVNGQLQLSNSDIETGLGITDGQSGQYTVFISGPFQGYVQHVMLNNTTSAFTNLSGFRGNTGTGTNGNIIP